MNAGQCGCDVWPVGVGGRCGSCGEPILTPPRDATAWGEVSVSALVPGARVLTMAGFGSHGAQPIIRTVRASEPATQGYGPDLSGDYVRLAFEDGFALRIEREQRVWAVLPNGGAK